MDNSIKVPDENENTLQGVSQGAHIQATQIYSGPIPPAHEMAMYSEVNEDLPGRIMTMAEDQAKHRQNVEVRDAAQKATALLYGFILSAIAIIGGLICILKDKDISGLTVIIANLVVLVGAFLHGKHSK